MDWSWINKFSGGLDVIPIFIALGGLLTLKNLPYAHRIETKLAYTLAATCMVSLPIAQIGWIAAVIQDVPFLGSLLDNVWTIYNFSSLVCILICLHTMEPRRRKGYDD